MYDKNPPENGGFVSNLNRNFVSKLRFRFGGPSGTRTPDQPVMSRLL